MPMTLGALLGEYDTLKHGETYVCTTKVLRIDDSRPWCYQGYKYCTHRVEHHKILYLYCVNLDVVDDNSSSFFLLFKSSARSGHPGYKIREKYEPDTVPQSINSIIIGKLEKVMSS
ncbi:hypothetical protein ACFE04_021651 [Oxalis oulophora]